VSVSLQRTTENAGQVAKLVAEIAAASREQADGIGQLNTAVTQMDKVTQSNAASAEESAGAAEELNAQALSVKESVATLLALVSGGASERGRKQRASPGQARAPQPASEEAQEVSGPEVGKNGAGRARKLAMPAVRGAVPAPGADGDFKEF
jgi:hypothetical protein